MATGPAVLWTYGRVVAGGAAAVAVVVVLILALAGAFHTKVAERSAARSELPAVGDAALATVRRIQLPVVETAVGTVRAVHEITLSSKLLAKVTAIDVRAGQRVRRGERLVQLEDAEWRTRLQQAESVVAAARAARDQAKIEFDRIEELFARGDAAKLERDRTAAAYKAAEAELARASQALREAQTLLDYTAIHSPIDGQVIDKNVQAGDTVAPGQALLTLYDPSRMQLVARVRESLTHRLAVDQPVDVRIDALGKTCQGTVSEIVPEAESASRTFSVKVTGPCPPGVYSGMFGRLLIPLDARDALVVPRAAVRQVGQLFLVEVAEDGVRKRRTVVLGRTIGDDVEVLSGLAEGERVVLGAAVEPGAGE